MVSITIIVGVSLIQTFVMLICFIFMFVVIKLTNKKKKIKKKQKKTTTNKRQRYHTIRKANINDDGYIWSGSLVKPFCVGIEWVY
jgi:amino acid permease